mmetsp:Transcript_62978/g.73662  ORF Transcript_62978/g.73662 Transcript_62978/m.73662 type:complete len:86 (+) Transcript_62978:214-471(+)
MLYMLCRRVLLAHFGKGEPPKQHGRAEARKPSHDRSTEGCSTNIGRAKPQCVFGSDPNRATNCHIDQNLKRIVIRILGPSFETLR